MWTRKGGRNEVKLSKRGGIKLDREEKKEKNGACYNLRTTVDSSPQKNNTTEEGGGGSGTTALGTKLKKEMQGKGVGSLVEEMFPQVEERGD